MTGKPEVVTIHSWTIRKGMLTTRFEFLPEVCLEKPNARGLITGPLKEVCKERPATHDLLLQVE